MRDRLIEILNESFAEQYRKQGVLLTAPHTADHLLANGVILPPCKVGDKVWFVHYNSGEVCEATIVSVEYNYYTSPQEWITVEYAIPYITANNHYKTRIDLMFGKVVFLTKEEAEKALAERGAK